ncbi:MAG: hypothetical protein LBI60_03765, partial [Bacteroidales bacterium]|nr:hypothetical protein [Bacteroidales bacterium]
MKKVFFIVLLNTVLVTIGISQNIEFTKDNFPNQPKQLKAALKNIRLGDKVYSRKENVPVQYRQALDYYNKAQALNENNVALNLKIANCYYRISEPKLASNYGKKAYEVDSNSSYKLLFFKGYGLQLQTMF